MTKFKQVNCHFLMLFFVILQLSAQNKNEKGPYKIKKRTYTYQKIKSERNLKLDLYQPKKKKTNSPLLIYVHGGGFSSGKRNDKIPQYFSKEMAKNGYIVASVSYRLTMKNNGFGCNVSSNLKVDAFNEAAKDIYMAAQYLVANKRKFKIDDQKIILVGSSAGAEAILHLVYGNTSFKKDIPFAGLVSMAGALTTLKNITKQTAIPTQLFHGTKDLLVPYNIAPHHYCKKTDSGYLKLFGSKAIASKLKKTKESYFLYTIENGDHSWNTRPIFEAKKYIVDFIENVVVNGKYEQKEIIH